MPTVEERLASLEAKVDTISDLRNLIVELRHEMNARFTDVNARFTEINARFTEVNGRFGDVNGRFTELRDDMNRRFTEMRGDVKALDQKVDRQFVWLVGTQLALLLAVVGALLGAYYR